MAVDFRCSNCGKLLNVEAEPNSTVRCPHCRMKVTVPAGLASLPRPHVPPTVSRPASPALRASPGPAADQPQDQAEAEPVESEAVMGAMALVMPWVISVFLHLGFFLIMLFFVMFVANTKIAENVIIPDAVLSDDTPGGVMDPKTPELSRASGEKRTVVKRYERREDRIDQGKSEQVVELFAPSADGTKGGADAELGLTNRDARGGPRSNFFGSGGNAYHIVYVVDRSGSMAPSFDEVRHEMLKSISRLKPVQDFDIVLFADNTVKEGPNPARGLVPADQDNKFAAIRFLSAVNASGQTTALPALQRAFTVLKYADKKRPGRLVYLLSDADFSGITGGSTHQTSDGKTLQGNEAVLAWLRDNNKAKDVYINTFLYRGNDPTAVKVMQTIAQENGGRFRQVTADE